MQHHINYTMLTDFYELTMGNGYFQTGVADQICYFDIFFRSVPDGGGFAIAAGLEQVISYIRDLHFDEEDIAYLRSKNTFSEEFLEYLRTFHFTGDIWAVPEGTPIFPREPILTVRAPAIEAQFVETYLLLTLNHQSLIATKSNRIVRAAQGKRKANSLWYWGAGTRPNLCSFQEKTGLKGGFQHVTGHSRIFSDHHSNVAMPLDTTAKHAASRLS